MKIISYSGTEGDSIVIQRPSDLYVLIDWFHSEMMDRVNKSEDPNGDFEKCAIYCSRMMDQIERDGFGSLDDVDQIEIG
jgi:hypothetical protein